MNYLGIIACSFFGALAFSQNVDQMSGDSTSLVELPGGKTGTYAFHLPPGQTIDLQVVERQGMSGIVSVLAPDGNVLVEADVSRRDASLRNMLIPPGAASIRVDPANHSPVERIFDLRLGDPHPATDRDHLRIQAEKLLGEAESLSRDQKQGHLQLALAAYEKALPAWAEPLDRLHQSYILLAISSTQVGLGEFKGAAQSAQKAFDLSTAEHDRNGIAEASAQLVVASLYNGAPKKQTDEYAARAVETARSLGDGRILANVLNIVADVRTRRGETAQSLAYYSEALALERTSGDRLGEADTLSSLSTLQHDLGHFKESFEAGERSLAIDNEEGDLVRTGSAMVRLSNLYASTGDFHKAISYGEQAAPILKSVSNPSKYANALYNLASYYTQLDDYSLALKTFKEALAIFQKIDYSLGRAYVLNGLASTYLRAGDEENADRYYHQTAIEFHKLSNQQGEVFALLALGGIASKRHQFSKAIESQQKALEISNAAGFARPRERSLSDLTDTYWDAGDARASLDRATQKVELLRKADHPEPDEESKALRQQGRAWRSLREYDRANEALERAVTVSESMGFRRSESNALYELAALDRDRGRPAAARDRILKALELLEAIGSNAGNAESRMLFAAAHRQAFSLAIDIAIELHEPARAFELSERARARALVDLIRGARLDIREGVDPALLEQERHIEEQLNTAQDRLARMRSSTHSPSAEAQLNKELDGLVDSYRQTEGEIRVKSPRYSALTEPGALSLGDVQSILPDPDTAVIEFWLGEERGYVWLVTKSTCQKFDLPPRKEIEPLARRA